ncbi:hypothetical protein L4C31_02385 [Aliivibrio sifiae]
MASRKKIDNVLLAVNASKVSQREWDFLRVLNSPDFSEVTIAQALLEGRSSFEDTSKSIESLKLLQV